MKPKRQYACAILYTATCATIALVAACQPDTLSESPHSSKTITLPPSVYSRISDERLRHYIATLASEASDLDADDETIGQLAMAYDANGFDYAAELTYRAATERDPEVFKWHYLLALRQFKNGDLESAIANANRAIETNDMYPGIYVRLGNWLLDKGELTAARITFERAIELGAGPAAELGTVRSLIKSENYSAALERLTPVISRTGHPSAYRLLSDIWRAIGDEIKAREYLQLASQAKAMWFDDPIVVEMQSHARGKNNRIHDVELLLGSGLVDEALVTLQGIDAQEQADFNVQYHFALVYFQKQMFDTAREHLQMAIELEPVHYPSHLLLASLYQRGENNVKAAEHLEHVVDIYPNLQIAHQELGFVRLRNGDTQGALQSFKSAISLDSTEPNVHYYAGVILGAEGRCEQAQRHFETTLMLDKKHDRARMAIAECERAISASTPLIQRSRNEDTDVKGGPID